MDEAVGFLEDADARASRAGMRAHLARLRYELARTLLARRGPGDRDRAVALIGDAHAVATELGQTGLLSRLAALTAGPDVAPAGAPTGSKLELRREGDYWCVSYGGRTARLRDSRGLSFLARLVENPGHELHVLQLTSATAEHHDAGDAGPMLDASAVRDYRRRLLELREELEEAERFGDVGRASKAREEMEFLTNELAHSVGLGGRERRAGNAAERARTTVQKRLRDAIQRIESELPDLGRHLDQTIRTGVFCGYFPDGRRR
jgi:hypothetical protein